MSLRRLLIILIGIAAVAVRCWQIDAPFFDSWSWRQSDVAAIARNYFENDFHFAYPQIDWAGSEAGFVGTEFPILPFITALIYQLFGVHEWIGRLSTIFFFALSLPIFFALARRAAGKDAAIFALLFYSFAPLSIATGRSFMPDLPSLSFSLAAFYFFWRWIEPGVIPSEAEGSRRANRKHPEQEKATWFLLAAVALALSILIKATSAVIGVAFLPLVIAAARNRSRPRFFLMLLLLAVIALAPSAWWYWHAHEVANQFYPHHFFGAGGVQIMNLAWYRHILWLTGTSSLTPILFLLALFGVFLSRANRWIAPFRWWLAAMIAFVIVVGYGNRHPWYQLPFVPIAAVFAGVALDFFARKTKGRLAVASALILFGAFSILLTPRFFSPAAHSLYALGLELKQRTSPAALIVIADDGDPTALYYAHRKGWHFLERNGIYDGNPSDSAQLIRDLEILRSRGATHLAFSAGTRWWLEYYPEFTAHLINNAAQLPATPDCRIYQLNQ